MSSTKRRHRPVGTGAGIAGQLREIIAARGLAAYSVAHSAGIAPSVVSRFLNRERSLTLETFDAIAGALGLRLVETAKGRRPGTPIGRPAKSPATVPDGNAETAPCLANARPDDDLLAEVPEPGPGIEVGPDACQMAEPGLCQMAEPPASPGDRHPGVREMVAPVAIEPAVDPGLTPLDDPYGDAGDPIDDPPPPPGRCWGPG